jgi:hypothetical protein
MSTLKPFYVTLSYSGVVMAEDEADAERVAERYAHSIVSDDGYPGFEEVTEVRSLKHLRSISHGWDGDCCTYGGDGPRLKDVLPEEDPPERDTRTADMFGEATGGAA